MAKCFDTCLLCVRARIRRPNTSAIVTALFLFAVALRCRKTANDNLSDRPKTDRLKEFTDASEFQKEQPVYGLFIVVDLDSVDEPQWNPTVSASDSHYYQQCIPQVRVYLLLLANNTTKNAGQRRRLVGDHVTGRVRVCAQNNGGNNESVEHVAKEIIVTGEYLETLNLVMIDAYIYDNVDYFYIAYDVIRRAHLDRFDSDSVLLTRYLSELSYMLRNDMALSDTGAIIGRQTSHRFLFLGSTHFHIFGLFFPLASSHLQEAADLVLYLYRRVNLTRRVSVTGSDVILVSDSRHDSDSDVIVSAERWPKVFAQEYETLQRYMTIAKQSKCLYCPVTSASGYLKVISMSLYGSKRQYMVGALRNAQLAPIIFPGWQLRFYCKEPGGWQKSRYSAVPAGVVSRLRQLGAEVRFVDAAGRHLAPMSWRFTVVDDPQVDIFLVRDADSRLTPRDAAAVSDWLSQQPETAAAVLHCIRDHPGHADSFINGGLWGAKRPDLYARFNGSFVQLMRRYSGRYNDDMLFLNRRVWPLVRRVTYCHDSVSCRKFPASFPFPVERRDLEHVGQRFDELSRGNRNDMHELATSGVDRRCVVRRKSGQPTQLIAVDDYRVTILN